MLQKPPEACPQALPGQIKVRDPRGDGLLQGRCPKQGSSCGQFSNDEFTVTGILMLGLEPPSPSPSDGLGCFFPTALARALLQGLANCGFRILVWPFETALSSLS